MSFHAVNKLYFVLSMLNKTIICLDATAQKNVQTVCETEGICLKTHCQAFLPSPKPTPVPPTSPRNDGSCNQAKIKANANMQACVSSCIPSLSLSDLTFLCSNIGCYVQCAMKWLEYECTQLVVGQCYVAFGGSVRLFLISITKTQLIPINQ